MTRQISIKTKFGWISAFEENGKIIKVLFGKRKNRSVSKNLIRFKKSLQKFFLRKTKKIKFNFYITGNSKQKKIWNELRKIRYGKTKTYGEIAKKHKVPPRLVGKICGQNKIILGIPCHRVIRSDGKMGGFSGLGGIPLKKKLLDFEKN